MNGKKLVWATIVGVGTWATWRAVRHGEAPFRRYAGILGAGTMLLLLSDINENMAGGLAALTGLSVAIGNAGTVPKGTSSVKSKSVGGSGGRKK